MKGKFLAGLAKWFLKHPEVLEVLVGVLKDALNKTDTPKPA